MDETREVLSYKVYVPISFTLDHAEGATLTSARFGQRSMQPFQ